MRIIDVNNFYSPTGGGVRTYHDRRRDYYRRREDVSYALVVPSNKTARIVDGNTTIYEVPSIPVGVGYRLVVSAGRLRRVFDDFAPDLVEVGSPYVLPLIVPRALGDRQTAVTGFYHADYPDAYVAPVAHKLPDRLGSTAMQGAKRHAAWIYNRMDAVCAASEYVLRKLSALGVRRLFRTPLGLDSRVFGPDRRDAELRQRFSPDGGPVLLFLNRLTSEKGIDTLLEGWDELARRTNAHLVIVGHGPAESRVDAFCAARPAVVRLPYLTKREDVAATLASADIFLSLGPHETFSLATAEALASGCLVVATDAGAAGELVRRENAGLVYRNADTASFVENVITALGRVDRDAQCVTAARIRHDYDWNARLDRMTDIYDRVITAKQSHTLDSLSAPDGRWWDTP